MTFPEMLVFQFFISLFQVPRLSLVFGEVEKDALVRKESLIRLS